jgi:hypothetical protein
MLEGLDPDRKRILLQFLYESNLIKAGKPVISLVAANLIGANLSGTYVSWANLSEANLLEADLRGANLSRAYLIRAIGLTQGQINEAAGDDYTKLPDQLQRPAHWSEGDSEEG